MGFPIADAIIGGVNAAAGVFNTAYSVYQDQRNYDYQKALQEKQWEREDTAVQRRRADLEAAGLNPNLAAGSSASSSTVPVGSHNITPLDLGAKIGNAIDLRIAQEQLAQQKEMTKFYSAQRYIAENESWVSKINTQLSYARFMQSLGYSVVGARAHEYTMENGDKVDFPHLLYDYSKDGQIGSTPLQDLFNYNIASEKNSSDILAKTNYWKNANELLGLINTGTGAVGNVMPRFNFNNSQSRYQGTSRNWNYNYNYRQPFGWH